MPRGSEAMVESEDYCEKHKLEKDGGVCVVCRALMGSRRGKRSTAGLTARPTMQIIDYVIIDTIL